VRVLRLFSSEVAEHIKQLFSEPFSQQARALKLRELPARFFEGLLNSLRSRVVENGPRFRKRFHDFGTLSAEPMAMSSLTGGIDWPGRKCQFLPFPFAVLSSVLTSLADGVVLEVSPVR
jgi:hypothetical protein